LLDDLRVLDAHRLVDGHPLDPLGGQRRRRDRRAAAEGLELGVLDDAVVADLELQLHDVAAGRRADQPGTYAGIVLLEAPDVARVLVVLQDLFAVCHGSSASLSWFFSVKLVSGWPR